MGLLDFGLWGEHRLFLTSKSFKRVKGKDGKLRHPTIISSIFSIIVNILIIILMEKAMYVFFKSIEWSHPLLKIHTNRVALARNLGSRAFSTGRVTICGFINRHVFSDLTSAFFGNKKAMASSDFEKRLFTYHPGAQRCALMFCSFQLKNFIDSLVFGDLLVPKIHHFSSFVMAWLTLHPGSTHFYVLASAVTEVPATISCFLANFDETLGSTVPGLTESFPKIKLFFNVATGISFLCFRTLFWSCVFYHYVLDLRRAWNSTKPSCLKWKKTLPLNLFFSGILFSLQIWMMTDVLERAPAILRTIINNLFS